VVPLPIAQITFRNRIYLGPISGGVGAGMGAYLVRTRHLGLAAELGMSENRPADRADVLAGTADRDVLASAGASLSYQVSAFTGTLAVQQGLNDGGGALATAQLSYTRLVRDRLIATLGGGAAYASARRLRREFGVTEREASRRAALIAAGDRRLRPDEGGLYRPGTALSHAGADMSLTYIVSQHWAATAFGATTRLGDTPANSPLVRERQQFFGGFGVIWRP
jgi:outer membrane scaffolding protein for murein synthesis (MipA/OmpV family)